MHLHRGNGAVFLWNLSAFLLCSPFTRLIQGQLKHPIFLAFIYFSTSGAFAKHHFFFLLGSYPLSTLVSLFLYLLLLSWHFIILDFLCFCKTISSHFSLQAASLISRNFVILDSPHFCKTCTAHAFLYLSTVGCLALGQCLGQCEVYWLFCQLFHSPLFSPCSHHRSKIFSHYIIFQMFMQFMWHFCHVLFTLGNRCTYTACQWHHPVSIQHIPCYGVIRLTTSDGEALVLEIWIMWSTSSLPLFPGSLWFKVVVPVRVPSMS